mmetsp:Transcript_27978/g.28424  ORF Transcript_27978/g.28424 Transcript_27978/m.28424 type:complete len:83 (-) Transcript_27978:199-447(-)
MKFFKSSVIGLNQGKFSRTIKASRTEHHGKTGGTRRRQSSRLIQPVGSIVDSNGRRRSTRQSPAENQMKQIAEMIKAEKKAV